MATYKEIQERVRQQNRYTPKTCWIAHVMSERDLTTRQAPNRIGKQRKYPCSVDKKSDIVAALRHFKMI